MNSVVYSDAFVPAELIAACGLRPLRLLPARAAVSAAHTPASPPPITATAADSFCVSNSRVPVMGEKMFIVCKT